MNFTLIVNNNNIKVRILNGRKNKIECGNNKELRHTHTQMNAQWALSCCLCTVYIYRSNDTIM